MSQVNCAHESKGQSGVMASFGRTVDYPDIVVPTFFNSIEYIFLYVIKQFDSTYHPKTFV